MLFKKLKLKNIRSYNELEIEFPKGSILLSGDIGAGKTSILLALQFALFGLQPGQKGASILRQGKDTASVYLELEVEGKSIILERSLKRGKSITQDFNAITIDGDREELSTSEMKNRVISLLKYPKEFVKKSNLLYKFTVYTPQEEMKSIIQERPEIRLDTLRYIFGIDRYKRIKENSQIFLQKIKLAIKIKEAEITQLNHLKEKLVQQTENKIQLSKQVNNLQIEVSNFEKQKNEINAKLNEIQEKIKQKQFLDLQLSNNKTELRGKQELAERLKREILQAKNQIKEKIEFEPEQIIQTKNLLDKHKTLIEELNAKFLNINSQISKLNMKKEQSQELNEKINSLENCPTCFQPVSQEYKEKISKNTQYELQSIEREIEPKIFEKNQTIKDIEKEKELIRGYEKDLQSLEANKIKFEHQKQIETKIKSDTFILDRTLNEIDSLNEKINQTNKKIQEFKETEKIYEQHKTEFEQINAKLRQAEISLAEKKRELEILKNQLENLDKEIKEKEKIRSQINYLRQLQDWLEVKFLSLITLTESNVLIKLRNEFSKIFNEWFSILVSDSLSVRLDEDFTPIIQNQDYEIDYEFLSGGERTAVALAYRLALNQVLNSLLSKIKTKDILILDEPTDGFSAEQLDKMRDIFQQLEAEQIILVSHEQKIEGFVDNVIKIKKDETSKIESLKP